MKAPWLAIAALTLSFAAMAQNTAEQQLLDSASYWQAQGRADLARQAIEKLLGQRPDDPELLYRLGEVDLALDPEHCHEPVARMRKNAPAHELTRALAAECFAATTGRLRLARLMQLHDSGRHQEAAEGILTLFQDGPPLGRTALIYFEILDAAGYPRNDTKSGLRQLERRFPGDHQVALAYAALLADEAGSAGNAIKRLRRLARQPQLREAALKHWRRALQHETSTARRLARHAAYLRVDPGNLRIREEYLRLQQRQTRPKAQQLLEQGQHQAAEALLRQALERRPDDAWLRYDLARLYLQLEQPALARTLMLPSAPGISASADMRYASALILRHLDEDSLALAQLEAIAPAQRRPGMQAMFEELAFARCLDQAGQAEQLIACEAYSGDRPPAWLAMGKAWLSVDPSTGSERLNRWLQQQPHQHAELLLILSRLRYQAGQDWRAPLLQSLLAAAGSPDFDAMRGQAHELYRGSATRAQQQGDTGAAMDDYQQARHFVPERAEAWFELARLEQALALHRAAADSLQHGLALQPEAAWQRIRYAETLAGLDQRDAALTQLDQVLRQAGDDDNLRHVALLRWQRIDDEAGSARRLQQTLQQHPDSARLWLMSADRAADDPARQQALLHRAAQLAETAGDAVLAERIERRLQALQDKRHGHALMGWDGIDKPGSAGISQLRQQTWMLEIRRPLGWHGHWGLQLDQIQLDAGTLPTSRPRDYAQFATRAPADREATRDGPRQTEKGLAAAIRLDYRRLDLELGLLSLGDSQSERLLGHLGYSLPLGENQLRLSLARRPQDSTLLAFAGAADPRNGARWGAVMRNSLGLSLARYEHAWNYHLGLRAQRYSGHNTADNEALTLRLATAYELWHGRQQHLHLIGAISHWRYDQDQGHYSFGHGGYYSPQNYVSGRLGVDWRGRYRRLSARLQLGIGRSRSEREAIDYFPADAALQQQASDTAAANGESSPRYTGGNGGGTGLSGRLQLEYGLGERWSIGAHYAVDRADFYQPDFYGVYLRRELDGRRATPYTPPQPPLPISRY